MGCFGLGLTRLVAAVVEASHDDRGIRWPAEIAPYRVAILPLLPRPPASLDTAVGRLARLLSERGFQNDVRGIARALGGSGARAGTGSGL